MDGENHGKKTLWTNGMIFGGFTTTPIFVGNIQIGRIHTVSQLLFNKNDVMDSPWPNLIPLVGGHEKPLKWSRELTIPKKGHNRRIARDMLFMEHMGVSKNRGTQKWMVYNGKPD